MSRVVYVMPYQRVLIVGMNRGKVEFDAFCYYYKMESTIYPREFQLVIDMYDFLLDEASFDEQEFKDEKQKYSWVLSPIEEDINQFTGINLTQMFIPGKTEAKFSELQNMKFPINMTWRHNLTLVNAKDMDPVINIQLRTVPLNSMNRPKSKLLEYFIKANLKEQAKGTSANWINRYEVYSEPVDWFPGSLSSNPSSINNLDFTYIKNNNLDELIKYYYDVDEEIYREEGGLLVYHGELNSVYKHFEDKGFGIKKVVRDVYQVFDLDYLDKTNNTIKELYRVMIVRPVVSEFMSGGEISSYNVPVSDFRQAIFEMTNNAAGAFVDTLGFVADKVKDLIRQLVDLLTEDITQRLANLDINVMAPSLSATLKAAFDTSKAGAQNVLNDHMRRFSDISNVIHIIAVVDNTDNDRPVFGINSREISFGFGIETSVQKIGNVYLLHSDGSLELMRPDTTLYVNSKMKIWVGILYKMSQLGYLKLLVDAFFECQYDKQNEYQYELPDMMRFKSSDRGMALFSSGAMITNSFSIKFFDCNLNFIKLDLSWDYYLRLLQGYEKTHDAKDVVVVTTRAELIKKNRKPIPVLPGFDATRDNLNDLLNTYMAIKDVSKLTQFVKIYHFYFSAIGYNLNNLASDFVEAVVDNKPFRTASNLLLYEKDGNMETSLEKLRVLLNSLPTPLTNDSVSFLYYTKIEYRDETVNRDGFYNMVVAFLAAMGHRFFTFENIQFLANRYSLNASELIRSLSPGGLNFYNDQNLFLGPKINDILFVINKVGDAEGRDLQDAIEHIAKKIKYTDDACTSNLHNEPISTVYKLSKATEMDKKVFFGIGNVWISLINRLDEPTMDRAYTIENHGIVVYSVNAQGHLCTFEQFRISLKSMFEMSFINPLGSVYHQNTNLDSEVYINYVFANYIINALKNYAMKYVGFVNGHLVKHYISKLLPFISLGTAIPAYTLWKNHKWGIFCSKTYTETIPSMFHVVAYLITSVFPGAPKNDRVPQIRDEWISVIKRCGTIPSITGAQQVEYDFVLNSSLFYQIMKTQLPQAPGDWDIFKMVAYARIVYSVKLTINGISLFDDLQTTSYKDWIDLSFYQSPNGVSNLFVRSQFKKLTINDDRRLDVLSADSSAINQFTTLLTRCRNHLINGNEFRNEFDDDALQIKLVRRLLIERIGFHSNDLEQNFEFSKNIWRPLLIDLKSRWLYFSLHSHLNMIITHNIFKEQPRFQNSNFWAVVNQMYSNGVFDHENAGESDPGHTLAFSDAREFIEAKFVFNRNGNPSDTFEEKWIKKDNMALLVYLNAQQNIQENKYRLFAFDVENRQDDGLSTLISLDSITNATSNHIASISYIIYFDA